MKIPGFAQLRMAWRILKALGRIADALERMSPAPNKKPPARAEVVEFVEETDAETLAEMSVRDGRIPWDPDE